MIKNSEYYIKKWQRSKIFCVEKDRIKPKSYLFSTFPKTNLYGFQDGNVRAILAGDVLSRFKRMIGYNVLFPVGYDSLGLSSFMENKKHSNAINDDICNIFKNQMLRLGVGIDEQKEIDLKSNSYLASLQLAFIELFEKGYIKYDYLPVLQDRSGKKIFDTYLDNKDLVSSRVKAFYLDLSTICDDIVNKISELPINKGYKEELLNILKPTKSLNVDFLVSNGTRLNIELKEPQFMGGITYICLNPDYVDFALYTVYDEYNSIEKYLTEENDSFGVFAGTYAINPLTGKKIPIFISVKYKDDIYVGNPGVNINDKEFALDEGLEIIDVISDGKLVESDFLNGLDIESAKELIINSFIDAEIGVLNKYYAKDKILLTSNDAFGALIPFLQDDDGIHSIKDYLPFTFSAKFRPVLDDNIDVPGYPIPGSINHIFSSGMASILSLFYDDIGASISIFSKEAIDIYNEWDGIECAFIYKKEIMENVMLPLCIKAIIEKENNIKLSPLFKKIIWLDKTYDSNYSKMKRVNNNLFDIEGYLNKYKGDALRLYFLHNSLNMDFVFDEEQLNKTAEFIIEIEEYYQKAFIDVNNPIDYELFKLYKDSLEEINDKNIFNYIDNLIMFYKEKLSYQKITKKQALLFLKLLYPIIPFTTEDIYENIFGGKHLLSDDGLSI